MYENSKYADFSKYVNIDTGLGRVRGNKNLYKRMLGMFLASDETAKLEGAIAMRESKTADNAAHAIKGMSGNLSLDEVSRISEALMMKFRSGEFDESLIAEYRDALEITIEIVRDIITYLDNQD